jgi:hypothetical protein
LQRVVLNHPGADMADIFTEIFDNDLAITTADTIAG